MSSAPVSSLILNVGCATVEGVSPFQFYRIRGTEEGQSEAW